MYKHLREMSILYVEDDENILTIFAKILAKFAKEVITAKNGEEGIEKFKEKKPDIIITDINMPKKNGLEMIKEIRQIDPFVVIIITTAYQEFEYTLTAIEQKVDYFFIKPISDIEKYLEILEKLSFNIITKKENEKRKHIIENILNKIFDIAFIVENDKIISLNKEASSIITEKEFSTFRKDIIPSIELKELEEIIKYKGNFFKIQIVNIKEKIFLVSLKKLY